MGSRSSLISQSNHGSSVAKERIGLGGGAGDNTGEGGDSIGGSGG
nr:hypothetical protein [Tanacetum cinerariifolium]